MTRANSQAISANTLWGRQVMFAQVRLMNRPAFSLAVVVLAAAAGCNDAGWSSMSGRAGSGVAASEGRKIDEIDAIVLDSAADVVVTVGGEPKLTNRNRRQPPGSHHDQSRGQDADDCHHGKLLDQARSKNRSHLPARYARWF